MNKWQENPKIILVLQSRLGSSRLPQKALYPLGKKTVLHQVLSNLKACEVSDFWLATDFSSELTFFPIANECGFKIFSGPEEDVLERFCLLIKQENPDVIVRATGDNPFLFTDAANFSIKRFLELNKTQKTDYFTLTGLPHGSGIEIFLGKSLLEAAGKTNLAYDHEHVGPALYNHPESFVSVFEPSPENWNFPTLRTTIDTFFDYKKAEKLYKLLDCENQPIVDSKKVIQVCNLEEIKNPMIFIPTTKQGRGTGHFRRCLALAEKLDSFFFLDFDNFLEIPENFSKILEFSTLSKENLIFGKENLKKLYINENKKPFSLVILDSFVTSKEKSEIAKNLGKILSLDEGQENPKILDNIEYLLDIIPSSELKRKPNFNDSGFIPKPKNKKNKEISKIETALISIGGEDPAEFSELTKVTLEKIGIKTTVVSSENPIPNLKEELYKYDLILTHYGFTAFEAQAASCKVILVATTKLHKALAKSQGFICLSKHDFKNIKKLKEVIQSLESEKKESSKIDNNQDFILEDFIQDLRKPKEHFCPVCNSDKNHDKVIFRQKTRTIKKCSKCKTLYLSLETTPISDYSESYFFTDYKNQYGKTYLEDFDSIKNQGFRRAKIIGKLLKKEKSKNLPKLLDIGCAYGPFLAAAKKNGFLTFGTDISKSATDYVSTELGFKTFSGDFTKQEILEKFNAISMWYVIEHFENLDIVLKKVNGLLENKGIFGFSTPSASGVSGRFKASSFLANSPSDHFSIWTFGSAKKVLKKYGFKIKKIVSTGHHPERFFKKPISKEKNPMLWQLILYVSKIFKLGDTFEVYCQKITNEIK